MIPLHYTIGDYKAGARDVTSEKENKRRETPAILASVTSLFVVHFPI